MTSHDVVAFARRALHQRRIGHTGTLDPFATGVLPLACGRATRLVRFMAAADKTYEATIRFGLVTDTYDITGAEIRRTDARPAAADVAAALNALRGPQMQRPPAFSAKRVDGQRAYDLARKQTPVTLAPAAVRLDQLETISIDADRAVVRLTCSAGFYVRSFAFDLGERLGVGACLETLRRTRSGTFTLTQAATIQDLDAGPGRDALISLAELLPDLPSVVVTPLGRRRVEHGQDVRQADIAVLVGASAEDAAKSGDTWVRILDESAALIAVGRHQPADDSLRPNIVLI